MRHQQPWLIAVIAPVLVGGLALWLFGTAVAFFVAVIPLCVAALLLLRELQTSQSRTRQLKHELNKLGSSSLTGDTGIH